MKSSERRRLVDRMSSLDYRHAFFNGHMDSSIAAQIKANREDRKLSQKQLAKKAGLFQSQVSKLEDVNHNRWTTKTLRRIARAFDLVLVIRLERFSKAIGLREEFPGNLVEPPFPEDDLSPKVAKSRREYRPLFARLEPTSTVGAGLLGGQAFGSGELVAPQSWEPATTTLRSLRSLQ